MTSYRAIRSEIEEMFTYLFENGLAVWWNPFDDKPNRITWKARNDEEKFLTVREEPSVKTYLKWLNDGQYSIMLEDGSLIQVTYEMDGQLPVGHRLAYIPCPYKLDWRLFEEDMALSDFVQLHTMPGADVLLRSAIRFDYDSNPQMGHPKSHLTINSSNCRIACASPLRIGRFFHFIYQNFYPHTYSSHGYLRNAPRDGWFTHTISEDDRKLMHLFWPRESLEFINN
jgi:hypothetical protein